MRERCFSILVVATVLLLEPFPAHGQGFGRIKKKVTLHRKLPAVAHLAGTKIAVKVTPEDSKNADPAKTMRDVLETELLKNEKQLSTDESHPDTLIVCKLTSLLTPQPTITTRAGFNGKNISNQQYAEVSGSIGVAYQAKDVRSGRMIDSDNIAEKYSREFNAQSGSMTAKTLDDIKKPFNKFKSKKSQDEDEEPETVPNQSQLQQYLIERAVKDITSRLVDTNEAIEVLLARGKQLDIADKMADQGLWSRMAEALETMTPFPKPEDDAYRVYNLGVAYEAQAYQAKDPKAAKKFLEQAAINYGKAIDDDKSEKYFLEPQQRIETAAAHYTVLEQHEAAANAPPPPPPSGSKGSSSEGSTSSSGSASSSSATASNSSHTATHKRASAATGSVPAKAAAGAKALTNQDLIDLAKAGMDEENLIADIREAKAVDFDLTPQGQLNLLHAGIKGKVLTAMRERAKKSP